MSRIYFVAGEASGDNHGADLLHSLREREPQLQFFGRGGPKMRAIAGKDFRDWIDQAAVVGLWEVIKHYGFFRREFADATNEIATLAPDAVVLIDYPGFNLRLARALREKIPRLKIIYYISPQVWAWNQQRVCSMARSIDLMLCIFPFEPPFYERAGLRALFVGHPMASLIPTDSPGCEEGQTSSRAVAQDPNNAVRDPCLIGIFPGSREREIKKIFPIMQVAALELLRSNPRLKFHVAAASDHLAKLIRSMIKEGFSIQVGQTRALMLQASAAMIASGTATLEAALSRLPFVLVYRVAWLTYLAARLVVKVQWLGMPNVLANREIVPEFIQHRARPARIARAVARLLEDENARREMLSDFDGVTTTLKTGETAGNAADAILAELKTPLRVI